MQRLDAALRDVRPDSDRRSRLLAVHDRARSLYRRRPDASLYQLVAASGNPLGEPLLRDSLDRRHAVKAAVPASSVKVRPRRERLMAMI